MAYFVLTFLICLALPVTIAFFWQKKPVFAIILASLIASIGPGAIKMVQIFQAMMVYGTGDPALMAGGISKALTMSVLSLIVFVPLLIFVQWIGRKLRAKKLTKAGVNSTFE